MHRDERGQALALMLAAFGLAAAVVASLAAADRRLLTQLHATRAAEAAAEAAGGVAAERLLELHAMPSAPGGVTDPIDAAVGDALLRRRAEAAARDVLASLDGDLVDLIIARRSDELSAKAEVRSRGTTGIARVGVRP